MRPYVVLYAVMALVLLMSGHVVAEYISHVLDAVSAQLGPAT